MKKKLPLKFLLPSMVICFILNCSAQSYTVYQWDFENWTDEKPDSWEFSPNVTVSKYTPSFSGSFSCKVEGSFYPNSETMISTQTFPLYWGKKYQLSFTARMNKGANVGISILCNENNMGYMVGELFEVDSEWNDYELEFITGGNNIIPFSSNGSVLSINIFEDQFELILDCIKLISVDNTMEFCYLDVNNINAYMDPVAPFYNHPPMDISYFEVPKNSKRSTFFNSHLWIGGMNSGKLHLAAQLYCMDGTDYWVGPVTNDYEVIDGKKVASDAYIQKYYHTWKVSKEEIEYHKVHYADPGYVMPWGISNWPAHGRTQFGESQNLAPYKDVDGNGGYTPWQGDYPEIRGDQAVYFIINDAMGTHAESKGNPLNMEILGMAYAYNSTDSALNNTIFLSYILRNKSMNDYQDLYFGYYSDFDIGFFDDDYVGCDTLLNLAYGYNATEVDGDSYWDWMSYGAHPPAQGAMFLNQKMSAYIRYYGGIAGTPTNAMEYYRNLQGKWRNNSPITYGGNGIGGSEITNYMFSGDPVTGTGWTEITPNGPGSTPNTPYDVSGTMSTGPFTLAAGKSICIDLALPFARDYQGDNLSSVALLKKYAKEIQQFYNSQNFEHNCSNTIGIKEKVVYNDKLLLFPNPSNGQFTVTCEYVIERIELFDMLGKKVFSSTPKVQTTQINTQLHKGLYIYHIMLDNCTSRSGKIMIQ